jgi:hypothetical protein
MIETLLVIRNDVDNDAARTKSLCARSHIKGK